MTSYNALGGNHSPSPYNSGDPYYNESSGFITPSPAKKGTSNWIKFGIPVAIIVIVGAVVGGVLGSRSSHGGSGGGGGKAAGNAESSAASVKAQLGRYATATNSDYLMPIYPSTVRIFSTISSQTILMLCVYRRTRLHSHRQRSLPPPTLLFLGPKILSSPPVQVSQPSAPTVLALSPLLTSGRRSLSLFRATLISRVGMTLYFPMPLSISDFHQLYTFWMGRVEFWIMLVRSK